ncbi:MAG: MBL fold metallo-hydrolase [Firmicutes bacterium]|nr:MBL fold metallo-hydrolase [Bacillota bacterium]
MITFIGIGSFLGFIILFSMLLYKVGNKKPIKNILIGLAICSILIVGTYEGDNSLIETNIIKDFIKENTEKISIDFKDTEKHNVAADKFESSNKNIKIHFIDVGQADSIFIDNGDFDILIDAGNNEDGDLVVNYLKKLNTDDIDLLVATHQHEDHIGGLDDVINNFKVKKVIDSGEDYTSKTYKDYIKAVEDEKNVEFIEDSDMDINLGNALFKVIETGDNYDNTNDNSVVTMLDYKDIEILFTGDMESSIENKNLDKFSDIDLLKIAHHGSHSSSSKEFLDIIKPEYAIISCGEDNRYNHPHKETLNKLNDRDVKVFRTDILGNIIVTTNGETLSIK